MKKSKTNKAWKRAAAGALSVALVAGTLPANVGGFLTESNGNSFVAFAEGETTAVEVVFTEVGSADALATAISEGKNPKLTADVSLSSVLTIAENAEITLDLNGHTITHTAADQVVVNGKFTVIDSTATAQADDNNAVYSEKGKIVVGGFAGFKINDGGTMIVNSGHINKTADGSYLIHDKRSAGSTAKFIINDGLIDMLSTVNNSMIALCGTIEVHGGVLRNQSQALKGEETSTVIIDGGLIESTANVDNVPTMYSYGTTTISGGTFRSSNEGLNTCIWVLTYKDYASTTTITGGSIDNIEVSQSNSAGTTAKGNLVVSGTPTIGTIYLGGTSKLNNVENDVFAGNVTISGGTIGSIKQYKANSFDSLNITGGKIGSIDLKNANNVTIADTVNIPSWKIADSTSLAKAFAAASANGTNIELTDDITLTAQQDVLGGKKITLDLNGKTINANDSRAIGVKDGELILTGEGTVSSTKTATGSFLEGSSVIRVGDGSDSKIKSGSTPAKLSIGEDVTISSNHCYGVSVFGSATTETVDIYGKIKVTGTVSALSGNGNAANYGSIINVYPSAEITADNKNAIYHPQNGILNITGGTIEGLGGIEAKAGTISITGGTITATGSEEHEASGNGSSSKGYAISAVDNDGYAGPATFNISGGTITGPVAILNDNGNGDGNGTISITGGKFSKNVSAYVAEGYLQNSNGQVVANTDFEYVISENGTIALDKDTTYGNISVAEGVTATIDLNGHNLNLAASEGSVRSFMVNKNANLTVTNSSNTAATVNAATQSTIDNGATFTVDTGVTLTQNAAEYTLYYKAGSTVNVNGTVSNTYENGAAAIGGNNLYSADSTLNINGGTVSTTKGNAIYHPQKGTLNVTGGTVSGETAIYVRMGTINISGGTFTANGAALNAGTVANGADPTGDALVFQSYAPPYGVPVVRISGGDFTSANANSVASYTANNSAMSDISITGGTFSDTLDTTFIAKDYKQVNGAVIKPELKDISQFVTLKLNKTSFSYNNEEFDIEPIITVAYGSELVEGRDYEIEGDLSATEVGTYVVKVKGIGNYKGEVTATWSITESYAVDVYYGTADYKSLHRSFGQAVTVTANNVDGKVFSHWATSDDEETAQILSYSQTYSFIVKGNVVLHAIYADEEVEQQAVLNLTTFKSTYNGGTAVGFDFTRSVPEGYTIKEVGLYYATNKLVGANTTVTDYKSKNLLVAEQAASVGVSNLKNALLTRSTVKKYVASSKSNNGTLRFSCGVSETAYVNAIGYVTYVNDKKETVTVYSDVMAASYNSMNN